MKKAIAFRVVAILALCILTGCAIPKYKTMPITVPDVTERSAGPVVKITGVADNRPNVFHIEYSGDTEARAFADYGDGLAFTIVVLPDSYTVADVIRRAVEQGMLRAGYRVATYDEWFSEVDIHLQVAVEYFWVTQFPSSKQGTQFRANISITGPDSFGTYEIGTKSVSNSNEWKTLGLIRMDTIQGSLKKGMDAFIDDIAVAVPKAN